MASIVKKLLIANRGEIALRVVRTAKEMGISTVAVYSEQDRNSRYVDMADEAYLLSGDTYKDTYLNEDLLIDILHKTGADAVHPGYGFLSEVPSFAQKVEDAGAIWVGPHHTALVDLGDKITARRVALRAKVPPVPGLSEPVTDVRTLLDFAHTHGYPIMMKRTDGGGGHGITVVHDDEELRRFYMNHDALQGSDLKEYFIEKFVDKARHVETQSGRDSHGNFTVYSTRDCSLQRRNQKLVEEAPAPFLSEEIISTLEEYSRRLFTTVGYVGLGTCEFMVTPNGKVYFLEVNPRLQVEHTVSEEVSGLDLVREQLNIAAGGELTRAPELRGHSFELRITSEDPATNLTPGSGTLEKIQWPAGPGVRIDTGVEQGDTISPKFDCPGRARQVQVGDVRHRDEQPPRQAHRATRHRGEHHRLGPRPRCQATHPAVARCGTAQRVLRCRHGQRRRQIRRHRLPDAGRGHAHQRVRRPAGGQGRPSGGARIHEDGELRVRAGRRRSEEDFRWPGRRRGGRRHAGHAGRERRQGQGCCGCAGISPSGGCVDSSLVRRSR